MFERFSDRGRRVVVGAQEEARRLHHSYIAPEHILLGLLRHGEGLAARALESLGVSLEDSARRIEERLGTGEGPMVMGHIPFTRGAKKVLELSLREALELGHNYIGTEHILLGVFREAQGDAESPLTLLGVDIDQVRSRIVELLETVGPQGSSAASSRQMAAVRGILPAEWSPALLSAERRGRRAAAGGQLTTGHLLAAVLEDPDSQVSRALTQLGVSAASLQAALDEIPVASTSDAPPPPPSVGFSVGGRTTTIEDPALAAALGALSPEELRAALRKALGTDPENRTADTAAG